MKAALILAGLLAASPAAAQIRVVDGDTIVVAGETIRLSGLDTPEITHARCDSERAAGMRAKARMAELLATSCGRLSRASGACLDIVRQGGPDRYGRTVARIRAGGVDVASVLIRDGYGREYLCPAGRCPRRAGWC